MRTGVGVEEPAALADRAVGAGFDFLLVLFDTALVDGAAFGFFDVRGCAGDLRGLVGWAEGLLPAGVVGSWLTGPAACIGDTGIPTVGCAVRWISCAIAVIRRLSMTTPYRI